MSAKWVRSRKWDDAFFPAWAWPAKFLLRAFSSIWLAVCLLTLVSIYGILASIPIGMLAAIPTWLFYASTALICVLLTAALPTWLAGRLVGWSDPRTRFATMFLTFVPLTLATLWAWGEFVWPHIYFKVVDGPDGPVTTGVKFFAAFCEQYKATTLRRLPWMEMSEMEFYAWWPLQVILLAFVANMVIATVRRIEFSFENLGVLTVHTGIVTIAMGSVYYATLKQEGDMRLIAGQSMEPTGRPSDGMPELGFYSREQPALWVRQQGKADWNQYSLSGLPRYNEYFLDAAGARVDSGPNTLLDGGRVLNMRLSSPIGNTNGVDPDVSFRVVGYASYCELENKFRPLERGETASTGEPGSPVRMLDLIEGPQAGKVPPGPPTEASSRPGEDERYRGSRAVVPGSPADRLIEMPGMDLEYTSGMSEERWATLATPLPPGVKHALIVEVPALNHRAVVPIAQGQTMEVTPGGYSLEVKEILPQPKFPIITKGFENALSSLVIVRVTPPSSGLADGARATPFERWVYHRYPEVNQDLLDETNDRGMPKRTAPDPGIKLTYLDASKLFMYVDEQPAKAALGTDLNPTDPPIRMLWRMESSGVRFFEGLNTGSRIPLNEDLALIIGKRWPSAERIVAPRVIEAARRERDGIGNHKKAAVAVEIAVAGTREGEPPWTTTLWFRHGEYFPSEGTSGREVRLPDGRRLMVGFGRQYTGFTGNLAFQLRDFEMTPFPHSDIPRDYRSDVVVYRIDPATMRPIAQEERSTSMNNPLLVTIPFQPIEGRGYVANTIAWLVSWVAPTQYKISQVGWDPQTWFRTKAQADRGDIPRPFVQFTILGVGNNPGIYVIAAGAVMMALGIPWAFYVKPAIRQAQKRRIQRELAAKATASATPASATTPAPGPAVAVVVPHAATSSQSNGHARAASPSSGVRS